MYLRSPVRRRGYTLIIFRGVLAVVPKADHPTLTRTLWSDQCLDAVGCESSRLTRPAWMLCLKIPNVDWTLIGPARDAVVYYKIQ